MAGYVIKKNDYVEDNVVRPEVVQRLIDYFLRRGGLSSAVNVNSSHSYFRGLKRNISNNIDALWESYECAPNWYDNRVRVKQSEMEEFARVWVENGYFISRGIDNKWGDVKYVFSAKPFTDYGYKIVKGFNDKLRN
jgi:hypothetical protein